MVVDHRVDVVEPDPAFFFAEHGAHLAAVGFPAATGRDAPEFLDVDVNQLAGPVAFVTDRGCLR